MLKIYPRATKIKIAMIYKGLNQNSLSAAAEINPSTFSNFLNGRYNISPKNAKKIADCLERPVEELFEFKSQSKEGKGTLVQNRAE